ncbi:cytosolic iron-sulfur assembly component 2A-like [Gigantopelta aegis]|uniref:cytosolic iron-sulfur assembly component 2A-like n=1 Tax=Gigantopelta aegis TaxID=1735272 RepID=UPI001B88A8A6|nr:cytosolic iron-sulfur assembly component 2A-like [Gigantopelta aegis]
MQTIVDIFKTVGLSKSDESDKVREPCMNLQTTQIVEPDSNEAKELKLLQETIYDVIRDVHDPEKPENLEELNVVSEDCVSVSRLTDGQTLIRVEFTPTVPHCSLASLIGLSLRKKMEKCLPDPYKIDIFIKEGSHETAKEINKQINDKERIAAAMENPNLRDLINKCIDDSDDTY